MSTTYPNHRRLPCTFLATVLAILPCGVSRVSAQEPGFSLHVQSHLVTLDAVVTDRAGNAVTTLTRNDFKVYENGVEQTIRDFEQPHELDKIPAVPQRDPYGRDDWGNAPLTMLVIDAMNTPFSETAYSRGEVERYLGSQPALLHEPTDVLWLNDSGFKAITPFSRDRDLLIQAVKSHQASLPDKLERGASVEQLSASLSALQQMALFSRGDKGSKQIIWVGRSFPGVDATFLNAAQREFMMRAVQSTLDLLMQSRVAIYVIDPTSEATESSTDILDTEDPSVMTPFTAIDPFLNGFNFMTFTSQTGGKYFYGRNDIHNEIENAVLRGTSFYTLTYVPTDSEGPARYRKIDIRLANPALRVQSKQGYYSSSHVADPKLLASKSDLQFDLHEAAVTGMKYSGVGVRFQSCHREANRPQRGVACTVAVDDTSLALDTDLDGLHHRASLVAVLSGLDKRSVLLTNTVSKLGLKLPAAIVPGDFTIFPLRTDLPKQATTIRVVIRDSSGRIGTADFPVLDLSIHH